MFRKIFVIAMFATAAGYCFAAETLPQIVTSEVFYTEDKDVVEDNSVQNVEYAPVEYAEPVQDMYVNIPAWPIPGSDADVTLSCDMGVCPEPVPEDNIKIVSKIGADLVVENNFNLGTRAGTGWSGGANMLHGNQIPVGFDDECGRGSEMPLLHREVLEDDGGNVLTVSRSSRNNCVKYADGYNAYMARNGATPAQIATSYAGAVAEGVEANRETGMEMVTETQTETETVIDLSADAEPAQGAADQVRSWVVANGQTLRGVLQAWCDKEGWDLVWTTSREYPIQASAVFKGRFVDVASAVVRNFARAVPAPYAKFYKGNRVLVISASEE